MRLHRTDASRRVRTALAAVALLGCALAAVCVVTDGPSPVSAHRGEAAAPAPALAVPRPSRAPVIPAVIATVTALVLAASALMVRRPALRPVPVPVRQPRGRGPPRSPSI